jgi:hypothetical protein
VTAPITSARTPCPGVAAIKGVDAASMDYRGTQYALIAETDPAKQRQLAAHLREAAADVHAAFAAYEPLIADAIVRGFVVA